MHKVTKIFTFDAAHRLSNYEGNCSRLHGHTYKLEVTVEAKMLDDLGMVIDFKELKDIYNEVIRDRFDHRTILFADDDANKKIAEALVEEPGTIVFAPYNPTAENMAQDIFHLLDGELPRERGLVIDKIRLYETPDSYAEYSKTPVKLAYYDEAKEKQKISDKNILTDEKGNRVDEEGKSIK